MFLLFLFGCVSVYFKPTSVVTAIAPSGAGGEFYVSSDVICGKDIVTSRVTLCHYNEKSRETTCFNVADTELLNYALEENGETRFKVTSRDVVCEKLKLDFGQSGWTSAEQPSSQ